MENDVDNNYGKDVINDFSSFYVQKINSLRKTLEELITEAVKYSLPSRVEIKDSLITEWCNIYQSVLCRYKNGFQIEQFQEWAEALKIDREKNVKYGHNFNMFEIVNYCGIGFGEVNHSKLLKFLFEPNLIHGQEYSFLYLFLEQIGIAEPTVGKWNITAEEGRIDVLLTRSSPLSVVIIENKSNWAVDQPNQLYRYWHKCIFSKTREMGEGYYIGHKDSFQEIYLTPNSYKTYDRQSISRPEGEACYIGLPAIVPIKIAEMTFSVHIATWIDKCIEHMSKNNPENHAVREYLTQYKNFCKTL